MRFTICSNPSAYPHVDRFKMTVQKYSGMRNDWTLTFHGDVPVYRFKKLPGLAVYVIYIAETEFTPLDIQRDTLYVVISYFKSQLKMHKQIWHSFCEDHLLAVDATRNNQDKIDMTMLVMDASDHVHLGPPLSVLRLGGLVMSERNEWLGMILNNEGSYDLPVSYVSKATILEAITSMESLMDRNLNFINHGLAIQRTDELPVLFINNNVALAISQLNW